MKLPGKPKNNQFLIFPNISSSNDPRGRPNHWEMNTSGIHFFRNFLSDGNETTGKNQK